MFVIHAIQSIRAFLGKAKKAIPASGDVRLATCVRENLEFGKKIIRDQTLNCNTKFRNALDLIDSGSQSQQTESPSC